jgi:antitoxin (DNA-binding transcriptional repressor) of toxin-antitoxin stability system
MLPDLPRLVAGYELFATRNRFIPDRNEPALLDALAEAAALAQDREADEPAAFFYALARPPRAFGKEHGRMTVHFAAEHARGLGLVFTIDASVLELVRARGKAGCDRLPRAPRLVRRALGARRAQALAAALIAPPPAAGFAMCLVCYTCPTMLQIPLDIAATRLAELMETAKRGEPVVIVKGDQAVRLVPVALPSEARRHRRFGSAAGQICISPDFDAPLEDFAEDSR